MICLIVIYILLTFSLLPNSFGLSFNRHAPTLIVFSHCHLCKCKRRLAARIYFSDKAYLLFRFTFLQDASARLAASKFLQACFESFALARARTAVLRTRNSRHRAQSNQFVRIQKTEKWVVHEQVFSCHVQM